VSDPSRAVLITGCSSGIGEATASRLAKAGWTLYATARRPETLAALEADGCRTLALDVIDDASRRAAVDAVVEAEGAVGVLINNAGYSQSGAVESIPEDRVRAQFDTNVFGPLALTRLVLPGMREQGFGKIVNISSMGGKFTFPGGGLYHATKYAIEAISDALRFEVRGFGIDVILIQPGLVTTGFSDVTVHEIGAASAVDGPYTDLQQGRRRGLARRVREGPPVQARRPAGVGRRAHRGRAERQAPPRPLHGHPVGARAAHAQRGPARSGLGRDAGHVVPASRQELSSVSRPRSPGSLCGLASWPGA
jgi:NADP-dependent 3-hydroxy acid dehydrogenase YdfG